MDGITRNEVAHLAKLSRLTLADDELDELAGQIKEILSYVTAVRDLDTEGVDPMSHPVAIRNVAHEDVIEPCLTQEEVLSQAPEVEDGRIVIPQILGEGGE
ncbi:MAG: Asp-tRNA(Asn)/Glu-tRNA(Gln) amidotransferase subunit GatC [Lawsonella sp.]|nr:Asp-tRNA(Asn)/Glu-tRNA(Gln) amidotransferase subunit GatC [Mycobacteriales bacterium]